MSTLNLRFTTDRSDAEQVRLRALVAPHDGLKAVSEWCAAQKPPLLVEIVAQDEFTHDLIVALDEKTFLVYDST